VKRGVLIYNPTAGQRDRRARMVALIAEMKGRGVELVNAPTERPSHATEIVRAFLARGVDLVVACGGDGTISEAAWGLSGSNVPLAVLPGGTSNVLARELKIPLPIDHAKELLLSGVGRRVRMLTANDRPFLLWAGVGLDARIMGHMRPFLKRWFGRAGIFCTVAPEFFRYEFPRLEVVVDGAAHEATFAVVCHARRYAGDWVIAPDASLESDELDVLLFEGRSRWRFFRLFQQIQVGRSGHLSAGLCRIVRGRRIEIVSRETYPVEVQVDGDCVLETPIVCRASSEEVTILVPKES
jgi:diacylglycerol kinase (ATP)